LKCIQYILEIKGEAFFFRNYRIYSKREGRTMNGKKRPGRPKGLKPPKRQYPLKLDEETRGQLAAAAYWTRQSANAIIEEGIAIVLRQLQEAHNAGKPFPPRPGMPVTAEAPGVPRDLADNADNREGQPADRPPATPGRPRKAAPAEAPPKRPRGRPRKAPGGG
jgi:hypothetical protein